MKNKFTSFVILLFLSIGCLAQTKNVAKEAMNIPLIYASYSYQFPFGDMAVRFGSNSTIGAGFMYKTENDFIWGIDWEFLFGGNVKSKDTLLKNIMTSDGDIINQLGQFSIVSIYERGNVILLKGGKRFSVWNNNPNSGLYVTGGLGFMNHKIRIDVYENDTPQLDPDYRKGYDRLSMGPACGLQAGYLFLGNNRLINFKAELELVYGLTHPVRPYNFDTMSKDVGWRHDFLVGLKVCWIIPLYPKLPKDFYYD
ncbi:MAG: hypothetical protein PHU62_01735 [Bacteroidales bacterium]|nr:hypothetical protein [Bacteroidales bacterium]MDD2203806.1 hypothetical protein [Bacteroidales bacterium]MDD3152915.1 hypothetical protein [Bacteroidales bacterium]MDD3913255.1 hypothetical protein [Bacteroidales bacterium]MDD4633286.1 hypothetical protein [Bacteroidales bacterium]